MKIGVMFGNPETTTGGKALKFYTSVRIEIRRMAQIKQGEAIVGNRVKAKVVKNKVARLSVDRVRHYVLGRRHLLYRRPAGYRRHYNVVTKSGNTFKFGETKLGVGRENAKKFLSTIQKLAKDIEKALRIKSKEVDLSETSAE
jgi:recombination protein RecA